MSFKYFFNKFLYREVSKLVDQNAKVRANEKHSKELQAKYAEKHRQNDIINNQKVKLLKAKIDIAENYLRNGIRILDRFERQKSNIDAWFFQNHWLNNIDQRKVPANYGGMKLTGNQKRTLLTKLNLTKQQYVPHGVLSELTEDSTLEFIIEHTPVVQELRDSQDKLGYRLYIASHYTDYSHTDTTICFGLVIKDDAKQPF